MPACWSAMASRSTEACEVALILPITDDPDMRDALRAAIAACI